MRKLAPPILDAPPKPHRSTLRLALMIAVALLLSPFVFEGARLGIARWRALSGPVDVVETPAIDALASILGALARESWAYFASLIKAPPWNPTWITALGGAWALLGSRLLMRRR